MGFKEDYEKTCKDVFAELEKTMASIDAAALERLTEDILNADQVFFVGVGRVMLALQCVCKRLAHLGIKAHYVGEITEPAITKKDLLIVFRLELQKRQEKPWIARLYILALTQTAR